MQGCGSVREAAANTEAAEKGVQDLENLYNLMEVTMTGLRVEGENAVL